jgi:1-acyl-sn-glycerol-3-phosphate acyltransferase
VATADGTDDGMSAPTDSHIGPIGWLRIGRRATSLTILLLACLALYGLAALLPGRNRVPRLFLTGVLRIVGGDLDVRGEPTQAPSILLANHLSWIDIPALAAATGTAFVAHDGLAVHFVMRFLCKLNRTVFIARNDRASVSRQVDQVREGLRESSVLTLFPEGTTGDGPELLGFKSSLLAAVEQSASDVAIRPVWVDYGALAGAFAWAGSEPGLTNATRILARQGRFTVTTHLLPPLAGEERKDRKAIATCAHAAIARQVYQRVAL